MGGEHAAAPMRRFLLPKGVAGLLRARAGVAVERMYRDGTMKKHPGNV